MRREQSDVYDVEQWMMRLQDRVRRSCIDKAKANKATTNLEIEFANRVAESLASVNYSFASNGTHNAISPRKTRASPRESQEGGR